MPNFAVMSQHLITIIAFTLYTSSLSSITFANDHSTDSDPRNVIYILTDDQRFDELGFMNNVIDTPHMDKLAKEGVHFKNAFVTTALCSPSRASILTGQYMHSHGVVDNNKAAKPGTVYFPSYLQEVGYETAFIGKWHMGGHHDDPQPGFDYWLSFPGQGDYYPKRKRNGKMSQFNINGKHVKQKGYITDELTDYTLNWLEHERDEDKPFFVYLSHKAVHANFSPAERHKAQYSTAKIAVPESQADTEENYKGKPILGLANFPKLKKYYLNVSDKKSFVYENGKKRILSVAKKINFSNAKVAGAFHGWLSIQKQKKIPKVLKLMQFPCFDALSYTHLSEGKLDIVIQCSNKIWDIHPLIPIINASGGIITTWNNSDPKKAGNIICSSNNTIHNKVLKILKPVSK